ncbi:3539_t:CDS:2, partial [Gigaspora margarita]
QNTFNRDTEPSRKMPVARFDLVHNQKRIYEHNETRENPGQIENDMRCNFKEESAKSRRPDPKEISDPKSLKKRKGKEKQITQPEATARTQKVRRRVNKENQDPLREGSKTKRRKKDKKKETKAEIARIHVETLESHIKGGSMP